MRYLFLVIFVGAVVSLGMREPDGRSIEKQIEIVPQAIAGKTKQGVEVRVNQLQFQRLGLKVEVPQGFKTLLGDTKRFTRTIAFSLSQKGQGTTVGPTHIELKNGKKLTPFMTGNQQFMSRIANTVTENDFDFTEYWFEVPNSLSVKEIFPITIVHNTTNKQKDNIVFKLENVEP